MNKASVIMNISVPPWGEMETALHYTGISKNWLLELVEGGYVRRRKRNAAKQSRTVYCIADIIEYLNDPEQFPECFMSSSRVRL